MMLVLYIQEMNHHVQNLLEMDNNALEKIIVKIELAQMLLIQLVNIVVQVIFQVVDIMVLFV